MKLKKWMESANIWLFLVALVIGIVAGILVTHLYIAEDPKEAAKNIRDSATLVAAALAVFGLGIAVWRGIIAFAATKTDSKRRQDEEFHGAVRLLNSEHPHQLQAALRALDVYARSLNQDEQCDKIYQLIAGFVRAKCYEQTSQETETKDKKDKGGANDSKVDVLAAIDILRNRPPEEKALASEEKLSVNQDEEERYIRYKYDFSNCRLPEYADFAKADFSLCNFSDIKCEEIIFEKAVLAGSNFRGAKLSRTRFMGANLRGVDFIGAKFSGKTDIRGADLTGAIYNDDAFNNIRKDEKTKLYPSADKKDDSE